MIEFQEIQLSDKAWMDPLFFQSSYQSEEYNFTFNFIWRKMFHLLAAKVEDCVTVFAQSDRPSYLFPAGAGDRHAAVEALRQDARERGNPFVFHTVLGAEKELLEQLYPGRFVFTPLRQYADYIYLRETLCTLSGKKLHGKRNHIRRFMDNFPDWAYEEITRDNIEECRLMNEEWCRRSDCELSESLKQEACAVKEAFRHYFELGLSGGLIRAGGEVVAFTMGDRLNQDTLLVHIEKAFSEIQGAYPIINQQFVEHHGEGYAYINREDDMGEEGLRRAKLSYQPALIVDKYSAKWQD